MHSSAKSSVSIILLLWTEIFVLGINTARGQEAGPPNFESLLKAVTAASHSVRNVHITKFKLILESRPNGSANWQLQPFTLEGDAWYNGLPDSKARISISREVLQWKDGPAAWIQKKQDIGFDGETGRTVDYRAGPPGRLADANNAILWGSAPPFLRDRFETYADGTAFSLNFYRDSQNRRICDWFADLAKAAEQSHVELPTSWDTVFGIKLVKFSIGYPDMAEDSVWLDPSHGYALRKIRRGFRIRKEYPWTVEEDVEVPELMQAAAGIWWPISAVRIERDADTRDHMMRETYRAEKVIVNDPKFDDHIFTIPFPPNYWVTDKIRGGSFYTTTLQQTEQKINKSIDSIKKEMVQANNELPESSISTNEGPPPISSFVSDNSRLSRTKVIVLFITLTVCLAIAIRIKVRWRHRGLLLVVCAASFLSFNVGRVYAKDDGENNAVADNCGVDVTYFALQWFGYHTPLEQIATELDAGEFYGNRCSLDAISRCLQQRGLHVSGYKADHPSEVLQSLKVGSFGIARTVSKKDGVDFGHYVVLIPSDSGYFYVDAAHSFKKISKGDTASEVTSTLTGEFLLINALATIVRQGPAFTVTADTVDLGRIPIGTNDFSGSLHYSNVGTQTLLILNSIPGCSCMGKISGDLSLPPGGSGTISLLFNRKLLAPGENVRGMVLQTNDPQNSNVKIIFKFDLAESPQKVEVNLIPRVVDYGRVDASQIAKQDVAIEIDVPIIEKAESLPSPNFRASSSLIHVSQLDTNPAEEMIDQGTSVILVRKYRLSWTSPPKGPFEEYVDIQVPTGRGHIVNMTLPIRGESILGSAN